MLPRRCELISKSRNTSCATGWRHVAKRLPAGADHQRRPHLLLVRHVLASNRMPRTAFTSPAPNAPATNVRAGRPLHKLTFPALGTNCEVQYAADDRPGQRPTSSMPQWLVQAFEAKYSRFRPDSLVSRINRAAGREWVDVDADTEQLLKLCDTLQFMTQGVLDPTALPLIRLWNWKAANPRLPSAAEIATALRLVGWGKVERSPGKIRLPEAGMALDFGALARSMPSISSRRLPWTTVSVACWWTSAMICGRWALRRAPAWHIGLEDPERPGKCRPASDSAGDAALRLQAIISDASKSVVAATVTLSIRALAGRRERLHPSYGNRGHLPPGGVLSTTPSYWAHRRASHSSNRCPAPKVCFSPTARGSNRGFYQYVATN